MNKKKIEKEGPVCICNSGVGCDAFEKKQEYKCENCGWNDEVSKKRIERLKGKA